MRAGEDALIARYFAPLAGPGADALRDDAATLAPTPGHDLVVTVDAVVAGVHYFPDDPPASVARKALGVNLSDLAAKGAAPRGFLLALALPDDWTEAWLAGFAAGLGDAAAAAACPLLGGDTVRSGGPAVISVTAFGEVPSGAMVRRPGARAGDRICVSGTIGDAALGLALRLAPDAALARALPPPHADALRERYLHPRPRLALAPVLRRHARAAMDVSDGLAGDLAKFLAKEFPAEESLAGEGLGARIRIADVPLSEAARAALGLEPERIETVLTGGDDYEILCAVPPDALDSCLAQARAVGVPLTVIGTVLPGSGVAFLDADGAQRRLASPSFSHF